MIRCPRALANLVVVGIIAQIGAALDSNSPGFSSFSSCGDRLQCGYIIVPKNYASSDDGIAKINLSRIPATSLPSMGTVFVNPGGPGGSGATWAAGNIDYLVDHIGSQWDIVGFDPRGIGQTTPQVHCFASQQDQINLYTDTVFEQGYTYPNMTFPTDPGNLDSLIQTERQHISIFKAHGEACKQNMDINDLKFMGSMTVARDVEFMSRVLDGDDSDVNFYGYSYGTIIGAYLLNMFPDRIGRLTLDGVVDVVDVANTPTNLWANTFLVSQEATYQAFLSDCAKSGPSGCPLAQQNNENTNSIDARIERFTQSLVQQSLGVSNPAGSLTAGAIRNLFVNALYSPSSWPTFSAQLASAMSGDGSALLNALRSGISTVAQTDATRFAVICSDAPRWGGLSAEDYASGLADALKVSRFAGGLIYTDPDGGCEYWPVEPVERYTGPWNTNPKNPVLIISNTADPVTPLINGRKAQERIAGGKSALIIQDGPGHTSLALPSDCTKSNIRSYWAGNLPSDGTVCEVSGATFPSNFKANFATLKKSADLVFGIKFIPF